jgi:hypothetical protein
MSEEGERISNRDLLAELHKTKATGAAHKTKSTSNLLLGLVALILFILFAKGLYNNSGSQVVSETTIHWHAKLKITEYGRSIVIPPSIGLLGDIAHPSNLHTHEADNIVHMEIPGPVKAEQIMLGALFDVWGREKSDIVKMFVNGRPNSEGYDYVMRDGDEIELVFK